MRELSVAGQRYLAVLAVIGEGRSVTDVAAAVGVSRQSLHGWLARYEAGGLEGLADRSHRPRSCPHQMPGAADRCGVDALHPHRAHSAGNASRPPTPSLVCWVAPAEG